MNRTIVQFVEPGTVVAGIAPITRPRKNEVLVETLVSAISAGTEMLVYRGQWPQGMATDTTIDALAGSFSYPLSYGYCAVGRVVELGNGVSADWRDRRVFAFQPHQSHFSCPVSDLVPIPDDINNETALFLPGMETALTLMLDGAPLIGEKVIVLGQGVIGLLTTGLLHQYPLGSLIAFDRYPLRREASQMMGAQDCLDPADMRVYERLGAVCGEGGDTDLIFELTGNPACLDNALSLVRYSGRIVIGSWYGTKKSAVDLGSFFHRGRISLISSQVSTMPPGLSGRWDQARRLDTAWDMLRQISPAHLITHRFKIDECASAYARIDHHPGTTMQVIFEYRNH